LLDVLGKCIDHSAFVVTLVGPEQPAADECVYLTAMKFDRKTAKASAPSRPATSHSTCGGFPSGIGFDGHTVGRLLHHADVLSDDFCSVIVPDCIGCRTLYGHRHLDADPLGLVDRSGLIRSKQ
jgi:hypothetical protein